MDATSQLCKSLTDGDEPTRLAAAQALAETPDAQAAATLIYAIADESDEVRQWVSEALENLGPPPAEQLPALLKFAQSTSDDQAYWAATLVGRLGNRANAAKPALARLAAEHRAAVVRRRASWALKSIEDSTK